MTNKPENPPAFPVPYKTYCELVPGHHGMSLRDYFAAAALQGMLASGKRVQINGVDMAIDSLAYKIADAMLKAREAIND